MISIFKTYFQIRPNTVEIIQKAWFSTKKLSEENFKRRIKEQEIMVERQKTEWQKRKDAIAKRYGQWNPTRKLSRNQISDLKSLKGQVPHLKTIDLANHFKVSPEAVRRILKSKWSPNETEEARMKKRGENRKTLAEEKKKKYAAEINQARARLNQGKSISLGEIVYSNGLTPKKETNSKLQWSGNRRNNTHNSQQGRHIRRPYVESVGDIID